MTSPKVKRDPAVFGLSVEHGAMVDALREAGYVLCIWTPADVKCETPEEGFEILEELSERIDEAMCEAGWEVINDDRYDEEDEG